MAETEPRQVVHEDVEHAIATMRRNLLESCKTGHWVVACWSLKEDGSVEIKGITKWLWDDALMDELIPTLKKRIAVMTGPAPGEIEPLPVADFMKEIEAATKSEPPEEEGK